MNGICHVEIPCTDYEKAKKFYGDAFGWEVEIIPEMDYAMFKGKDGPGGGFSKQLKVSDSGVLFYLEVEDIEAALKKVGDAGGQTVKEKTQISPDVGYFGIFTDSDGNVIGLWSQK
jgi:predicted enzyme related to lactoylglutathione lyase